MRLMRLSFQIVLLSSVLPVGLVVGKLRQRATSLDDIKPDKCLLDSTGRFGSRKIGIVIDASGSMFDSDPDYVRVQAAVTLNAGYLQSKSQAKGKAKPDLVTVIDFSDKGDAKVLYSLGDPAGAIPAYRKVTTRQGTYIGGGIKAAIDELTKPGSGTTEKRTGIVLFSDGVDNDGNNSPPELVEGTMSQIERAKKLGIRINFGYLKPKEPDTTGEAQKLGEAVTSTGGMMVTFSSSAGYRDFVTQLSKNGLTGSELNGKPSGVVQNVENAVAFSKAGENAFTFTAEGGQIFNVTITTPNNPGLKLAVTLRDTSTKTKLASAESDKGTTFVEYKPKSDTKVEIRVEPKDSKADGWFTIKVGSSGKLSDPCASDKPRPDTTAVPSGRIPQPSVNITIPTIPKVSGGPTSTVQYTGAASGILYDSFSLPLVLTIMLGTTAAGLLM